MDVLDIVRAKLPEDNGLLWSPVLAVMVAEVRQSILTYCNRSDIPPELAFVHANMVVDLINGETRKADPEAGRTVTSIKEGDTTVSYGSAKVASSESAMQRLLFDYKDQLNRFRKLRR